MSKSGIYCVYDAVLGRASPVWSAPNDDIAIRQYRELLKSVDASDKPEMALQRVGWYEDDQIPQITPCDLTAVALCSVDGNIYKPDLAIMPQGVSRG